MLTTWRVTKTLIVFSWTIWDTVTDARSRNACRAILTLEHARPAVERWTVYFITLVGAIRFGIALPKDWYALLVGRATFMVACSTISRASLIVSAQLEIVWTGTFEVFSAGLDETQVRATSVIVATRIVIWQLM